MSSVTVATLLALSMFGCGGTKLAPNTDGGPEKRVDIGGTVSGLAGGRLVLRNNGADDVTITVNGTFKFSTKMSQGSAYAVTVAQQPTGPHQTCVVTSAGTHAAGDVTNVAVACSTNRYLVGGTVTGLAGTGLVLRHNAGNDLAVAADGAFTFAASVASGATFTVSIFRQPEGPSQNCQVAGASGTIGGAHVTSVVVNCATKLFTVGGTVVGLAGTGLAAQNNGGETVTITANGSFAFATPIPSGGGFAVVISAQPSGPTQICTVSSGTGSVVEGNVTAVGIDCTTSSYAVGGSVSGLAGGGLVLQNNLGDNLAVAATGTFSFATAVPSGGAYAVTVLAQPTSPSQTCVVGTGSGLVVAENRTDVTVTCTTNQYFIGGTVTGLLGAGLTLRDNAGNDRAIAADGTFLFESKVASGNAFAVSIAIQPAGPSQTCVVAGGTGTVVAADVLSVVVDCSLNTYSVSGTVSGLLGTGLALSLNGGSSTTVSANGGFAFPGLVGSGSTYAVAVTSQPTAPWQTCVVTAGSGTIVSADVANVAITCSTNSYVVTSTISGLAGAGLTLTNNGEDVAITSNGVVVFPTRVSSGGSYAVSVKTQPSVPTQVCTVSAGTGVVAGGNIMGIAVTCVTSTYQIRGTISGLAGQVILNDNGGDPLMVNANGGFQFGVAVASGAGYAVTVATQPATPNQTCVVVGGSGTVIAADIASVVITCVTNRFAVGGTTSGLLGSGLVLRNSGGDDLTVAAGAFAFAQTVASGAAYVVTIATQPSSPSQTCVVTGGSGTVGAADVTGVAVNCTTNTYTVGGTVSGLAGAGLSLRNGGVDLPISGSGAFAFAAPVPSGGSYLVSVTAQPTSPWQTCTVSSGGGTVGSGNVGSVVVTCVSNPYHVVVDVSGLAGVGLVLQNNGGNNLAVSANGTATFTSAVASGAGYQVTVLTQPTSPWQICAVSSPTGVIAGADITIAVACTTSPYSVGGTVSGLGGTGLVIQNNAGDDLTINANGTFTFPATVASGAAYAVTVRTQPTGIPCVVTAGSGTIAGANVTNVTLTCSLPNGPANGCSFGGIHAYRWDDLGTMTWKACVVEAAKRGALLVPGAYTTRPGWGSHRLGANAQYVTTSWSVLNMQAITNTSLCIVGRDPFATTFTAALASTRTYDGQIWHYQDFGPNYYDECQLLASNAGAMVITPYTIGLTGDGYWVVPQHTCSTYDWITGGGTSMSIDNRGVVRSSVRSCMVGFVEQ